MKYKLYVGNIETGFLNDSKMMEHHLDESGILEHVTQIDIVSTNGISRTFKPESTKPKEKVKHDTTD